MNLNTMMNELLVYFDSSQVFRANNRIWIELYGKKQIRHILIDGSCFEDAAIKAWLKVFGKEKKYGS